MNFYLSSEAKEDLGEIWLYIAKNNPVNASRVEEEILQTCGTLAKHPHIGHSRDDLTGEPLRFFSIYHYLIVYAPETKPLEIVRILSGYRDLGGII